LHAPRMENRPPYLWPLMLVGVGAISCAAILIKLCSAPPLAIAGYRLGIASVIMWPAFLAGGSWRGLDRAQLGWALLAGLFLALHFGLWLYSLTFTSVASSVVLVTINPLFVGLFGWLFLGERVGPRLGIAVGLVLAGGALIGGAALVQGGTAMKGNLMALAGALMASLYLLVGRKLRSGMGVVPYATACYSATTLLLLAGCLATRVPLTGFPATDYLYFALLAVGPQILGHTVFNWGLRYLPASRIAMLIVAEPIGATVLAYLILHQRPSPGEVAGGILILAGVYLSSSR
jgi:drug/metabolite transporter (DMT)-like permease